MSAKRACLAPELGNVTDGENCLGPLCGESHVDQIQSHPEQQFRPPRPTGWTEHCRTLKHSPSSTMLLIVGAQMGNDLFCPLSTDRVVGDRNLPFHFGSTKGFQLVDVNLMADRLGRTTQVTRTGIYFGRLVFKKSTRNFRAG